MIRITKNPFVDGVTNIAIPDSEHGADLSNHHIRGNLYGIESKVIFVNLDGTTVDGDLDFSEIKSSWITCNGANLKKANFWGASIRDLKLNLKQDIEDLSIDEAPINYLKLENINSPEIRVAHLEGDKLEIKNCNFYGKNLFTGNVYKSCSIENTKSKKVIRLNASKINSLNINNVDGFIRLYNSEIENLNIRQDNLGIGLDLRNAKIKNFSYNSEYLNGEKNIYYMFNDHTSIPENMITCLKKYGKGFKGSNFG